MRTPGPARSARLAWLQPKALGRVREGKGLRKRGTHDSTVRGASQSGSSRRLAAVGRAHASRVCFIFITPSTVLSTFSIALLGFPLLLALDLFSLPLLSPCPSLYSVSSPPPYFFPSRQCQVSLPSGGCVLNCGRGWRAVAPGRTQSALGLYPPPPLLAQG